ncbi:MAG: ATP-dependent helicase HrpB [Pseudomonadota bacterium]
MSLPVSHAIPELLDALRSHRRAVLQAPPGAGKTTLVPLEMMRAGLTTGRILMLEPRRLAARAAAERMASMLGEPVGKTVGYRIRGEAKTSKATRIEVVTEGILTRMIQSDPELSGIGAVIFDEFHERSLNADLGLALCLEVAGALRDDLILLAMSATLDAAPVAALMTAPVITAEGRSFPVDIRHLDRPVRKDTRFDASLADLVQKALNETDGGVLVFLPGEGEIRRVASRLSGKLPPGTTLLPLYGALPFKDQRAAITPLTGARKLVLATSIAETSLTIEDIRVVVDGGRSRRSRFDPSSGMARLVTETVTRAEADQRAGRAGRMAAGICYRHWTKGQEGALAAYPPAEIEAADLAGFALELALWGAGPDALPLLTPPNPGSFAEAQGLLQLLGALDAQGRITEHGKGLAKLPVHPRLAHMLATTGPKAARLAALLSDRDPLRGVDVDIALRLKAVQEGNAPALTRIREEGKRLARLTAGLCAREISTAGMAALAYPDRIGLRRKGEAPRYVLAGGKGAVLPDGDPMGRARLIVATDLDGDRREARVRQAALLDDAELRALFGDQIVWQETCHWDKRTRRVAARRQEMFGALILDDRAWTTAPEGAVARAMLDGVRDLGLTWSRPARLFAARVRVAGGTLPDMSETALMDTLEDWLLPYITGVTSAEAWKAFNILDAMRARLSWEDMALLDRTAPASFTTPLGRSIAIDYSGDTPEIALRLQEMFGQTTHPVIGTTPLRITLLSPAGRPLQTTQDLPGFWASSYADVRKDMRGRYPKHPWPEDPTEADPTLRAKRRKPG